VALLEAQAGLRKQLLGRPYAEAWVKPFLQHTEDPLVREFAIRWFFGAGDESQAEFWLMHQHAKRLETPVWQNLALAMERNDQDSIYRIISEHSNKIDHMSKILAVRQLGRLDDTWVLAMDTQLGTHHFNAIERTTMLCYARNIASESPNAAHLS